MKVDLEECKLYLVMIPLSWERFQSIMMRTKLLLMMIIVMTCIKSSDNYTKTCHDYDYPFPERYSFNVETIYSVQVSYDTPTIPNEKIFAYVESSKFSMLVDHEKNALGSGYIVEFIHDATENYYEGGTYAYRNCNNVKFPLYVLKISKLCLFCLPIDNPQV